MTKHPNTTWECVLWYPDVRYNLRAIIPVNTLPEAQREENQSFTLKNAAINGESHIKRSYKCDPTIAAKDYIVI